MTLSSLAPGSVHRFRPVAVNASGTTRGPVGTIATPAAPEDAPAPPAASPAAGRTVVAGPVGGSVRVRRPGARSFAVLESEAPVPVGSVIDATRGRIRVASALGSGGAIQTATFWGGVFQVRQRRAAGGVVDLHLRGPAPACGRPAGARENAVRRPVGRGLWGKDSKGKYRTHGRNSVATVRGTVWMTRETCAGTLTRVTEGAVSVRDVRRGRTVLVRAGASYLARHRR